MTLNSKVLVATDLSDVADDAIREGYVRACRARGELIVCHAVPDLVRNSPMFPQRVGGDLAGTVELERRAIHAVEERVEAVTGQRAHPDGNPVSIRVVVETGIPETVIVRSAEEHRVNLVVVSSSGASGLDRLLLGSVAARVVRYAHAPVLVARRPRRTSRVIAATDFSHPALPAVAAAIEEARAAHAKLTLLHAFDVLPKQWTGWVAPLGPFLVAPPPEIVGEARKNVEEALRAQLARFGIEPGRDGGVEADVRAAPGNAATAILQAVRELDADLVVVATRGRTSLARMVLGSVAERVVTFAPCSVLVVRADATSPVPTA